MPSEPRKGGQRPWHAGSSRGWRPREGHPASGPVVRDTGLVSPDQTDQPRSESWLCVPSCLCDRGQDAQSCPDLQVLVYKMRLVADKHHRDLILMSLEPLACTQPRGRAQNVICSIYSSVGFSEKGRLNLKHELFT